jgi:hypothetical protein
MTVFLIPCFFLIFLCRNEGVSGYYKGLVPNLLRVVPATAITFVIYENVQHSLLGIRKKREARKQEQHYKETNRETIDTTK